MFAVVLVIPDDVEQPSVRFVRDVGGMTGSTANAGASSQTFQQQPYGGFG